MRSWAIVTACVACGGSGASVHDGSSSRDGTYQVELTAGSGSAVCTSFYASYFDIAQTIVIDGSNVTVSDSMSSASGPIAIAGSDLAFEVTYQTSTEGGGQIRGDESYMLVIDAGALSGRATGTFVVQASPSCSLTYAVAP